MIFVIRGGGGSGVLRPTGLGFIDGLGAGEEVGVGVKSLGSGIATEPEGGRGRGRRLSGGGWGFRGDI